MWKRPRTAKKAESHSIRCVKCATSTLLEVGKSSVISFGDGSISDKFQAPQCVRKDSSTRSTKSNPVLWNDPVLKCLWFTNKIVAIQSNMAPTFWYAGDQIWRVWIHLSICLPWQTWIDSIIHKADAPYTWNKFHTNLKLRWSREFYNATLCSI